MIHSISALTVESIMENGHYAVNVTPMQPTMPYLIVCFAMNTALKHPLIQIIKVYPDMFTIVPIACHAIQKFKLGKNQTFRVKIKSFISLLKAE
jgi:hypothetical protein